jgi:hypothetical protein
VLAQAGIGGNLGHVSGTTLVVVVDADAIVTIDTLPAGALGACAEAG